jgi:hypothetical protein
VTADKWIRRTTIGCVGMLALIAGTVSYLHMHLLVELHGQPGWVAALTGRFTEAARLARAAAAGTRGIANPTLTAHFRAMEARALSPDSAMHADATAP